MTTRKSKGSSTAELEKALLGDAMTFGKALMGLRELYALSQGEMGKRVGLSKQHVCDIEKERRSVSPAKAATIARKLGHPEAYFVRLALQGRINHDGLKFKVSLEAA
ncbi:MAG: XRE family transcriptional regulator [Rhodospirillaceae bacterium]|nr:XRE family transcriptional regulator [Rhodospirillaceae bacterium]